MTIPYPALLEHRRAARNGFYPTTSFLAQAVYAENHIVSVRKKQIYQWGSYLGGRGAPSGGTIAFGRHRFHTGYGTTKLVAYAIIGRPTTSAVEPYVTIDATIAGGATSTFSPDMHSSTTGTAATDAVTEWMYMRSELAVTANTTYELLVKIVDHASILSLTIYEECDSAIDDAVSYFNETVAQQGLKVIETQRERLLVGLSNMWKRNGGMVINWHEAESVARTRTSATAINLIDDATTGTPTAHTPGYTLDLQYRTTRSRAVVPCVLAVYGAMSSGSGTVRITDTAGASPISVTVNSATPGWFTATGNLVAAAAKKYDPMFLSDGSNTLSVEAVSLYEYEA